MKRILSLLLCFLLLTPLCLGVQASDPGSPSIVDNADILTGEEISALSRKADELRYTYDMHVVILVVRNLDGRSAQAYADDFYDINGYGVGSERSGVLLLIATESRDWWISTCGDAIYALTDYGIEQLFSSFSGYLALDNYYGAFCAYLDALPEYFEAFQNGDPIDGYAGSYDGPGSYSPGDNDETVYYEDEASFGIKQVLISLLIGCAVAAIAVFIMSAQMNTKRRQNSAGDYIDRDSYRLNGLSDLFLYSNVTKTARQESSSSGGGGSSTHSSSSGRSHGGGGGKF